MAGRKAVKEGKDTWNSDAIYADVQLSEADKDAFSNWMTGVQQDFGIGISMILQELYRVSFKVDVNNDCIQCVFTQQDFKHHNHHLTIISRSDDAEEAFWLNVYKVHVLYENQRLPTQRETRSWG